MKEFILLATLIFSINSLEEDQNNNVKRLTYKEIFDPENSYYVLNTEEEYKAIKNLEKSELIKNSSTYTYEWTNHEKNVYINFKDYLPPADSEGYRDMTQYDFVYLNVYSKKKVGSQIVLVIECQKREPDEVSSMKVCYKRHIIPINFVGWREIKISYSILVDGYGADLSKVSNLYIHSNGWGCVPNKDTDLFIDQILFTKIKYVYNMEESEIFEENYANILKKFKYSLLSSSSIVKEKSSNILKRLKNVVKTGAKTYGTININGLPFNYEMKNTQDMNGIYNKIK